jgi:ABC-type hemin transport system ATPase subunit
MLRCSYHAQGQDTVDGMNVRAYVAAFNLKGAAQEKKVGSLSGGERNRVHLAKVKPQIFACNELVHVSLVMNVLWCPIA